MTPPELSLTVPVMPPNVCCATDSGADSAATAKSAASRKSGEATHRPEDIFHLAHSKKVCLRRVGAISKSLRIRLQSVQDNEVAMPETARAPENRAPDENPHAGGIVCKDNATFQKFNQKLM